MRIRYPKNTSFECQRCAKCCGDSSHRSRNIFVLESEVDRISKKTDLRPLSFVSRSFGPEPYRFKIKKKNGKCFFLDGKACRIYDTRPLICHFYPFSLRKRNDGYIFDASDECPGIGLGERMGQEKFEEMLETALKVHTTRV